MLIRNEIGHFPTLLTDKKGMKRHLVSGIVVVLVLSLLFLSGPAYAINVGILTENIDISTDTTKQLVVKVDIEDGEFLPVIQTDVSFFVDDQNVTCSLDQHDVLSGCDFLRLVSKDMVDLLPGFGYGYALGGPFGAQQFGYGPGVFGYGYGSGNSFGSLIYTFEIDVADIPSFFVGKTVDVEALVIGGDGSDNALFVGTASFQVTGVTNSFLVGKAKDELNFGLLKAANVLENQITGNLNLPQITEDGVIISWGSSDSNRINPFTGKVTRSGFSDIDKLVSLTATLSKGTVNDTKTFILTVLKEGKSDTQSVADALNAMLGGVLGTNSGLNSVVSDLSLPTTGTDSVKFTWSSSHPSVITSGGTVSRPQLDTSVTLTVVASKGSASTTSTLAVTVLGTTDLDELAVNQAKFSLTDSLVLNGNPGQDRVLNNVKLPTSLTGHSGVSVSWTSSNTSVIGTGGTVTRDASEDKSVTLTATLSKSGKTTVKAFNLIVKKKPAPAVAATIIVDGASVVTKTVALSVGQEEVLIDSSNSNSIDKIEIPDTFEETTAVVINVESLVNQATNSLTLAPTQKLTLTRNTATKSFVVDIPAGTQIQGKSDWNGLIQVPTVKVNTTVPVTTGTPTTIIEIGVVGSTLTFDKATKIVVPGEAGQAAGFLDSDDDFHNIPSCSTSQIADPNTLPAEGDCKTDSGSDLIIWTKHFTQFFSFTPNPEVCNGLDDDGDGTIDEGVTTAFYEDSDDDDFGDPNVVQNACTAPSGFVDNDDDCDDGDAAKAPGLTEIADGKDNDCDVSVDEGFACVNGATQSCGTSNTGICQLGTQTCVNGAWGSCTGAVLPGTETCNALDDDCDGTVDDGNVCVTSTTPTEVCDSVDNDGDGQVDEGGVCPPVGLLNGEFCNGVDDDFDGKVDESFDNDDDGYTSCGTKTDGSDKVVDNNNLDCQDYNLGIHPGAAEMCNGVDEDCDGRVDEDFDKDGDKFTTCGTKTDGSDKVVGGLGDQSFDCRDDLQSISPARSETCNGLDDNCNGKTDENLVAPLAGNQYGICRGTVQICVGAKGWAQPDITLLPKYHANESLTCDGLDNNCDGRTDEGWPDTDKDGWADCRDINLDNDNLANKYDPIIGRLADIKTNFPGVDIFLDGMSLIKVEAALPKNIVISGGRNLEIRYMNGVTKPILEGRVDLVPETSPLQLYQTSLFVQGSNDRQGLTYVNGIDPVTPLTAYMDRISQRDEVCLKDDKNVASPYDLSKECTASGEIRLACDGQIRNGYSCTVKDGRYQIKGFTQAVVVREIAPVPLPGDFDDNFCVDFPDFIVFAKAFNTLPGVVNWEPRADFDSNNVVEFSDFVVFAKNYGAGCSPKPATKPTLEMINQYQ